MLLMQCFAIFAFAQLSISGKVSNEEGEALPGASVVLHESYKGTTTNLNGQFEINVPKPGTYQLEVSFIGYETEIKTIEVLQPVHVTIELKTSSVLTEEVLISAHVPEIKLRLPNQQLKKVPLSH